MANELSYGIGRITGSPDPVVSSSALTKGASQNAVPAVSGSTLDYSNVVFPATTASDQYVWFTLPDGATLTSAIASDGSFGFGTSEWIRLGTSQTYVFNRQLLAGIIVRMNFEASTPNTGAGDHPPRVSIPIGNYRLTVGTPLTFSLSGYFTDPDGDALTYQAQSSSTGLATASVSGTMLTVSPVAPGGPVTITVTATDPRGHSVTDTFAVEVVGQSTGNRPPRPIGNIPGVSVHVGDDGATSVAGYFDDPDNNIDTWSATSSDSNIVRIVSASHGIIAYHGVTAGTASIAAFAHYGSLQVSQAFQVVVQSADAIVTHQPVVISPIIVPSLVPGESWSVQNVSSHFEDLDGTTPTIHLVSDYNRDTVRVAFSGDTLTIHAYQVGATEVKLIARDAAGASVQTQIYVNVHKATSQQPSVTLLDFLTDRWLTIDEFIVYVGGEEFDGDNLDDEHTEIVDDQRRNYGLHYTAAKRVIQDTAPEAPFEVKNEALVKFGGYMAQKNLAPAQGEMNESNFFVWSGAYKILARYRQPNVGIAVRT